MIWHLEPMKELLLKAGESGVPDQIHLNAKDYIDLRRFGRDDLDFTIDQILLKSGFVARLFGIAVYVSEQETPGIVRVIDDTGKTLVHWNGDVEKPCLGEINDCDICLVARIMAE